MTLLERIDKYLVGESKDIDWSKVKESMLNAAKDIFDKVDKVDKKKIEGMVDGVKKKSPKDTEDAIQIGINMMRGE